jgi:hypothetical protein
LRGELEDGLFEDRCLLGGGTLLGGNGGAGGFVLNLRRGFSMTRPDVEGAEIGRVLTAISKSTSFSANVLISLLKQNRYSPTSVAVNTKSPWRSLVPSRMTFSFPPLLPGPTTE